MVSNVYTCACPHTTICIVAIFLGCGIVRFRHLTMYVCGSLIVCLMFSSVDGDTQVFSVKLKGGYFCTVLFNHAVVMGFK